MENKKIIQVRFSNEQFEKIEKTAKEKGLSLGGFLRMLGLEKVNQNQ